MKRMKLLNEVMPVIVISAQARGVESGRRSSRPPTDAALTSVCGAGRHAAMTPHTATARPAQATQTSAEPRQPSSRASGTATSGGTKVPSWRRPTWTVETNATRSGKYALTIGGTTTLPSPMPASARTLRARKRPGSETRARTPSPRVIMAIAATVIVIAEKRVMRRGARNPQSP